MPPGATRICIIGAGGRMGRSLLHAAGQAPGISIVGAVAPPGSALLGTQVSELSGTPAGGVCVSCDLAAAAAAADVVIDFSAAAATRAHLAVCRQHGKALLIGTTGLDPALEELFTHAAGEIPLLVAPNTSLGATLLIELVRTAARALPQFDIEVLEAHHRGKQDAPSGTALALARAAEQARGRGGIGFAVLRAGDLVGEHTVLLAGRGERLSLAHQATDRAIFARGALSAAVWLAPQPPGRYEMRDIVLGNHRPGEITAGLR